MHRVRGSLAIVLCLSCGGSALSPGGPGPDGGTSTPPVTSPDPTVRGKVVGLAGQPIAGARVRIGSLAPVTTDSSGTFEAANAPATYDAAVAIDAANFAIVYVGLTRRDPTLYSTVGLPFGNAQSPTEHESSWQSVTVMGAATGSASLFDVLDSAGVHSPMQVSLPQSVFPWYGPSPSTGRLAALVTTGFAIVAGGHTDVQLGGVLPALSIPVVAAAPWTLQVTTNFPASCPIYPTSRVVVVPGWFKSPVVANLPSTATAVAASLGWTDEVPLSLQATAWCFLPNVAQQSTVVARRLSSSTTTLAFDVPAPPTLGTPADGATIQTSTRFTWTAPAATVSILRFWDTNNPSNLLPPPRLDVVTAAATAAFPDLTAIGAIVAPGRNYDWSVEAWGSLTSADSAADPSGLGAKVDGLGDFVHSISAHRGVTVAQ